MLEDSALDAELAVARLHKANLAPEVTLARDRGEFEAAIAHGCFDLILADYALPDFDGIAALAHARENMPNCPFIFISGRVGEEVAIDTLQRGATDYVLKHRLERLVPAVIRALNEAKEHAIRMEAEEKFRQSELRFRQVIEAVPEMIWVSSPRGALTYSNQSWRDYVPPGLLQWCRPELIHPEDYAACAGAWSAALESRAPLTIEARLLRCSDNTYRWHLLRVTPMTIDSEAGEEVQWLGTATDLQDQKLNEEALRTAEKLSVTGRMTAAIAHEINNPLEAITNCLYLLEQGALDEEAKAYLTMAQRELDRVTHITTQTLRFYRQSTGPTSTDVGDLIESVLVLYEARIRDHGIQVVREYGDAPAMVALEGEIRQVLANLIGNAIDAMMGAPEPRRLVLRAHGCRSWQTGEPSLAILVADAGSGMSRATLRRIFEPFFSTKGITGTGLGLWVSREIIAKHSGSVQVRSSEGAGTIFRILFPIASTLDDQPYETSLPTLN